METSSAGQLLQTTTQRTTSQGNGEGDTQSLPCAGSCHGSGGHADWDRTKSRKEDPHSFGTVGLQYCGAPSPGRSGICGGDEMRDTRRIACWTVAAVAACAAFAAAEVRVAPIFGDHMVLQRDQRDKVWGWANPGEAVTVTIDTQTHKTTAGAEGK